MKKIAKLICVAAIAFVAASCSKVSYVWTPYISFDNYTMSANEDAGTITIKVSSHNLGDKSATVAFKIENGTAVAGKDIDFVGSPSVTFTGDQVVDVVLKVTSQVGTYTGNLVCTLKADSISDGVVLGAFDASYITIKDLDHPLAQYFGTWAGKGFSEYDAAYSDWEFTISADDKSVKNIVISGFDPAQGGGKFTVPATTSGFVIPDGTLNGTTYGSYGNVYFRGFDAVTLAEANSYCDIEVQYKDGKLFLPFGFISRVSAGALERFSGNITLTKK